MARADCCGVAATASARRSEWRRGGFVAFTAGREVAMTAGIAGDQSDGPQPAASSLLRWPRWVRRFGARFGAVGPRRQHLGLNQRAPRRSTSEARQHRRIDRQADSNLYSAQIPPGTTSQHDSKTPTPHHSRLASRPGYIAITANSPKLLLPISAPTNNNYLTCPPYSPVSACISRTSSSQVATRCGARAILGGRMVSRARRTAQSGVESHQHR